jgi:alkanesulfonate monooxygenase SsuD/methylene tetrahydromethanopterin reductase-like flavin-dependent oxidoreductase (luciferase family)
VRFLLEPETGPDLESLAAAAGAAHGAGLDGVLLAGTPDRPAPLVAAAALAGRTPDALLAAEVAIGDRHPLLVAEEAAVVDRICGGRLILVLCPAEGCEAEFAEATALVRTALAGRPFRFEGERWQVPGGLPQNDHADLDQVRVMPAPQQARLEVWSSGVPVETATAGGLGHLADPSAAPEILGRAWADAARPFGSAAIGLARARRDPWAGAAALVDRVRAGRAGFGQDWSIVRAPASAAEVIGREVRPRVQLERLPDGLEEHWARDAPGSSAE